MPIFLNKVARANPQDRTKIKFYPTIKTISCITEKQVAKQVADETTLNPKEAEMAISQLEKVLIANLMAGNSVKIGDWGTFHLTCNGEGSETEKEVSAGKVKGINVRFVPGKTLTEALKNATFVMVDKLQKPSQQE